MLWSKGWLETRWRLAYCVAITLLGVVGANFTHRPETPADAMRTMNALGIVSLIASCFLAGCGVKTQGFLPVQMKTAGESIYFTLALPVAACASLPSVQASASRQPGL